tara:strand:- start:428 stop:658 length:231 start_codon:yes stop_codon:yes gene_type:complete
LFIIFFLEFTFVLFFLKYHNPMSNDLNDSQITKNLIIFFLVIASLTVALAYLGIYIQESEYRENIEIENRESLKED